MRVWGSILCGWLCGGVIFAVHHWVTPLPLAGWVAPIAGTLAAISAFKTFPSHS